MIFLAETYYSNQAFSIRGFDYFHYDSTSHIRGILILIRGSILYTILDKSTNLLSFLEILALQIIDLLIDLLSLP